MSLRVGSVGYATEQGLGILLKAFYDHGVITDVAVVHHGHRPTHPEWFPGCVQVTDLGAPSQVQAVRDMAARCDAMLFWETPFVWDLIPYCRERGIKTALGVMYECEPKQLPYQPDVILCPSLLDLSYYPHGVFLPVPVDVPWRQRERAEVFVHNAGWGGLRGRNGTREVLEAIPLVKSDARFIVRSQRRLEGKPDDPRVRYVERTEEDWRLYAEGDAFLFPERFNGLSLPLQEARAAGMLVMAGDRFPMHCWLPSEPLIPVHHYDRACVSGRMNEFDEAVYDPREIAVTIDRWYGRDLTQYSLEGRAWAEEHSWARLGPKYLEELSK